MNTKSRDKADMFPREARKLRDEAEVWKAVEKSLHYEVEPSIRIEVEFQGLIEQAVGQTVESVLFKDVLAVVKRLRKMAFKFGTEHEQMVANRPPASIERSIRRPHLLDRHVIRETNEIRDLWACVLARQMANTKSVTEFRKDFLGKGLLAGWSSVRNWTSMHMPSDRYATLPDVLITMEMDWDGDDNDPNDFAPMKKERVYQSYDNPHRAESVWEKTAHVGGTDSPLGRLVLVGAEISRLSGWLLGESIWFILTGEIPCIPTLLAIPMHRGISSTVTILMEVDPEVSPDKVRSAYKRLRDNMKVRTRHRSLDAKTIAFVRFVCEKNGVNPYQPKRLAAFVDEWNKLESTTEKNWGFSFTKRRRIAEIYSRALKRIEPRLPEEYWDFLLDTIP